MSLLPSLFSRSLHFSNDEIQADSLVLLHLNPNLFYLNFIKRERPSWISVVSDSCREDTAGT